MSVSQVKWSCTCTCLNTACGIYTKLSLSLHTEQSAAHCSHLKGVFIFPPAQRSLCMFHSPVCSLYSGFLLFRSGLLTSVEMRQVAVLIEIKSVQQQDARCSLFVASWHLDCPSPGSSKLSLNTQSCNSILLPKATKRDPIWIRKIFPNFRVSRFQTCDGTYSEAAFRSDLHNSLLPKPSDQFCTA